MPALPSRYLLTVLAGVLGGLAVIAVSVFLIVQLRTPPDLTELLPADRVYLLLRHASAQDTTALRTQIPSMPQIAPQGNFTLALLRQPGSDALEWVVTPHDRFMAHDAAMGAPATVERLTVYASSPELLKTLSATTKGASLAASGPYRALRRGLPSDATQLYVHRQTGMEATGVLLAPILRGPDVLLAFTDDGVRLRSFSADEWRTGNRDLGPFLRVPSPAPSMSMGIAGNDALAGWTSTLSPIRAAALQGMLAHELMAILGEDVSLTYDLLPLLAEHAVLHARMQGSGRLLLLDGMAADVTDVRERVASLRSRLRARGAARIDRRVFDGEYQSSIVRLEDAGELSSYEDERNGWTITGLVSGHGRGVFLAASGPRFLLATDRAWLDQVIDGQMNVLQLPDTLGQRFAAGALERPLLSWFLPDIDSIPGAALLRPFLLSAPRITWTLGKSGNVTELALRNN